MPQYIGLPGETDNHLGERKTIMIDRVEEMDANRTTTIVQLEEN